MVLNICILNFIGIRWRVTEILGSKVLSETACILCTKKFDLKRFIFYIL
jgi:hypothetical protein